MNKHVLILVICLLHSVFAENNELYQLMISKEDKQLTFKYLDKDDDGKLNKQEVNRLFDHHEDASEVAAKFVDLIDGHDAGNDITLEELSKFIDNKEVTYALHECSFEMSMTIRRQCYEDRIITFVNLVLPNPVIHTFFDKFDRDEEGRIGPDQVRQLFTEGTDKQQADEANNFLSELGGNDMLITEREFHSYVKQEDLHDDFRVCKNKEKQYDFNCLKETLVAYTRDSLTEMDIKMIFTSLDTDHDDAIEPSDLIGPDGCNTPCNPEKFLSMMDTADNDKVINFAEFRNFVKKYTIRIRIQKRCTERYTSQALELECYRSEMFKVVGEHHKPIWLTLPKSDMLMLFERTDVDNDGKIEIIDDLKKLGYPIEVARKLIKEMDSDDEGKFINLKEFLEYVGDASVVYHLSDCRKEKRGKARSDCYNDQLKEYITDIMDKRKIADFFKFYDHDQNDIINVDDLQAKLQKPDDIVEFLDEIGMGDDTINRAEFRWYVRQKELISMFNEAGCEGEVDKLHGVLITYVKTKMTELNIQYLFDYIDKDESWDLEPSDWQKAAEEHGKSQDDIDQLMIRMDLPPDHDKIVNFEEFRFFMVISNRKKVLEEKCISSKAGKKEDRSCYLGEIWNM